MFVGLFIALVDQCDIKNVKQDMEQAVMNFCFSINYRQSNWLDWSEQGTVRVGGPFTEKKYYFVERYQQSTTTGY